METVVYHSELRHHEIDFITEGNLSGKASYFYCILRYFHRYFSRNFFSTGCILFMFWTRDNRCIAHNSVPRKFVCKYSKCFDSISSSDSKHFNVSVCKTICFMETFQ